MQECNNNIIELKNIYKVYSGVIALKSVDFFVKRGKVNGIVGENGAGKTTLLNIINGTVDRTSGDIFIDSVKYKHFSNSLAKSLGILTVTQHVQLFPELTIAENLFFNETNPRTKLISFNLMCKKANEILKKIGSDFSSKEKIKNLRYVDQQMIEICKVVYSENHKVIILDEPTAPLPAKDIEVLFNFIKKLKEDGVTFIFVSHFLDEVIEISDFITVLRDGENVLSEETKKINIDIIIKNMIGKDVELFPPKISYVKNEIVLKIDNISKSPYLKSVSFYLKKGEILGIAGLRGSGNTEISKIISGIEKYQNGIVLINNKNVKIKDSSSAKKLKIGYLSNDRFKYGIFPVRSVRENISIGFINRIRSLFFINYKKENSEVSKYINLLNIKTPSPEVTIDKLSGGNQQKTILSRLIGGKYNILVMEEPTFGVDINVKSEIHKIMYDIVKNGASIILVSDDFLELTNMCDRILVLKDGVIEDQFDYGTIDKNRLTAIVGGNN